MAHLKTPKLLKKKIKSTEERHDDDKEHVKDTKESTKYKILSSLKLISGKDKNSETRKSKRKSKTKSNSHEESEPPQIDVFCDSNPLIKVEELDQSNNECGNEVIESVNEQLRAALDPNDNTEANPDSKDVSENETPSVYSDYSYNRLTTDTSEVSSRENISDDFNNEDNANSNDQNDSVRKSPCRKSMSLTRRDSITKTIKGIFRRSKTDPTETVDNVFQTPKLFKPASKKSTENQPTNKLETSGSIRKTSSIKRKISNFMSINEVSQNLSRSMSVRDIKKACNKSNTSNDWSVSLKSLAENDIAVSYNDLSFVNYDALNTFSYKDISVESRDRNCFRRTHSMSAHNVSTKIVLCPYCGVPEIKKIATEI